MKQIYSNTTFKIQQYHLTKFKNDKTILMCQSYRYELSVIIGCPKCRKDLLSKSLNLPELVNSSFPLVGLTTPPFGPSI